MEFLPVEVKSMIFEYLTPSERIACKLVCKTWHTIFMTDPTFKGDRKLSLNYCLLHPDHEPLLSLQNSDWKYDSMELGSKVTICNEADPIWGRVVWHMKQVDVDLSQCDPRNFEFPLVRYVHMFASMPHLRRLTLRNFSSYSYSCMALLSPEFLERLVKRNVKLKKLSELVIIVDTGVSFSSAALELLLELLTAFLLRFTTIKTVTIENVPDYEAHVRKLVEFKEWHQGIALNLEFLNTVRSPMLSYFIPNFCEAMSPVSADEHRLLSAYKLMRNSTRAKFEFQLKNWRNEVKAMKYLKELEISDNGCFFGHEPMRLNNVKKLTLWLGSSSCRQCMNSIYQSFPNVEHLIDKLLTAKQDKKLLALQAKFMNRVKVTYDQTFEGLHRFLQLTLHGQRELAVSLMLQDDDLEIFFEKTNSNLRSLCLDVFTERSYRILFEKLFKGFPHLESLVLCLGSRQAQLEDFLGFLKFAPKLRRLEISKCETGGHYDKPFKVLENLYYFAPSKRVTVTRTWGTSVSANLGKFM